MHSALIAQNLDAFQVSHDPDFLEYLENIILDSVGSIEENQLTLGELLTNQSETLDASKLQDLIDKLYKDVSAAESVHRCEKTTAPTISIEKIINTEVGRQRAEDSKDKESFWNFNSVQLQDAAEKKRIIEKYGVEFYDTIEFNEDGRMRTGLQEAGISTKFAAGSNSIENSDDMWTNDNRKQVTAAEFARRQASKLAYEKEQEKIKSQKEKAKLKQDKEKSRVAKKERRSGR